ncbi:cytochrome P450 [Scenedesmus sp. NREL 46B-D3]|nr:cytochrome P450 [Scenedesmus sp. NREL 46B-D3]
MKHFPSNTHCPKAAAACPAEALLGEYSISITQDAQLHSKLRQVMGPTFSPEAVAGLMPGVQQTVAKHVARWAQQGSFTAYPAVRLLTFDVLVNQALQLGMDDAEIAHFSTVFKQWVDGFMPPAINLPFTPFGKGMAARLELQGRVQQSLRDPKLGAGVLRRLRDEFGADSQVASDNTIVLMFAGYDTTSSAITYMLNQLSLNPHVMQQVRQEQAAVQAQHGPQLTPAAVAAMPYTTAVVKETLRTAQVIGYVPRVATQPLKVPGGGPELKSGCPFIVALGAISAADPAAAAGSASGLGPDSQAGSVQDFRPERWLEAEHAKSLALHQAPFGMGAHYCLGSHLAMAELTAVLSELGRSYSMTADTNTDWQDFPIKRPTNGLPCTLQRLAAA